MKETVPYIRRVNEALNFYDTCRFLGDKIIQNLKPNFSSWETTTYGCEVKIVPGFPEGYFIAKLSSIGLDIAVNIVLREIGFDAPCRTVGDMEKLWDIPHAAVLRFQDEHREEILEWSKTKERHNFLANPVDYSLLNAASRGKGTA
jgi:hypothetical protein